MARSPPLPPLPLGSLWGGWVCHRAEPASSSQSLAAAFGASHNALCFPNTWNPRLIMLDWIFKKSKARTAADRNASSAKPVASGDSVQVDNPAPAAVDWQSKLQAAMG